MRGFANFFDRRNDRHGVALAIFWDALVALLQTKYREKLQ